MTDKKISELTSITGADVSDADDILPIVDTSVATTKKITRAELFQSVSALDVDGNITVGGTVDGRDVASDGTKLDGIEAGADVTDSTNVEAAGALMDSEVTNLAAVKAFDPTDYATAAQGSLADSAVQPGEAVPQTSTTGSAEIPAGTDAERDGTPSAGYFRFNTDSSSFEGYDGTAWGAVGGSADLSAVAEDIIPDADSTRDIGSTSNRWAQGWFDDVTLTNLNGNPIATAGSLSNRNKIINGTMQIAQRGTNFAGGTTNADDAYTLDRWYVLSEGSDSIDVDQIADSPDTGGKCIRLDVETTGEKFGIAQIVEASNCTGLIGNTVTLSFAAKVSNARIDTIKAAVVAWSGTADTVTSDIISAWNADGTTPTLIANATFENTPADLGVTTSWATYEITANVDTASTANLIVFIWSDDATNPLAGDFLYVTNVQLEAGDTATPFEHRSYGQELALCQRYYYEINYSGAAYRFGWGHSSASTQCKMHFQTPVPMRATPTFSSTSLGYRDNGDFNVGAVSSPVVNSYEGTTYKMQFTVSGATAGTAGELRTTAAGVTTFDAEL